MSEQSESEQPAELVSERGKPTAGESTTIGQRVKSWVQKVRGSTGGESKPNPHTALTEIATAPGLDAADGATLQMPDSSLIDSSQGSAVNILSESAVPKIEEPPKTEETVAQPKDTIQERRQKPPRFIREFSREQSAEERSRLAREIWQGRKEYFQQRRITAERQAQLKEETSHREINLKEQLQKLQELRDRLSQLSESRFKRVLNYTHLRGLTTDLATEEQAYQQLRQEQDTQLTKEQDLTQQLEATSSMTELESGRKAIQDFYEEEKEIWAETPYDKADIQKYFTEDHLKSLSMGDYMTLLRRFPNEMVTHVTRQGIRDHIGGDFHTAGLGEYSEGFMQITNEGRLRSAFGIYLKEGLTDKAIAQCLELGGAIQTREDAELMLDQLVGRGRQVLPGSYADRTAVHLAAEEVADNIYGSERGNEMFFAFPSAHIASQYYFAGQLTEGGGDKWNDQRVWTEDRKGVAIDAGVVFIPEAARVDAETGSRYELNENKRPIENQEYISSLQRFVESENFPSMYESIVETLGRSSVYKPPSAESIQLLQTRLAEEFGINDPKLQMALLNIFRIRDLSGCRDLSVYEWDEVRKTHSVNNTVRRVLQNANILFKETTNPTTSRQFWENYFRQHPDQQPSHLVYYQGDNPTKALKQWRESQGITKKAEESKDLGFPEKDIGLYSGFGPQATVGINRFRSRAQQVIGKYFDSLLDSDLERLLEASTNGASEDRETKIRSFWDSLPEARRKELSALIKKLPSRFTEYAKDN
ncbi:hypothetical protein HY025_01765 [Candidatus Daviesbacteria bacterium]|nr:hypothetical protein [Candidatus Daviesbacteria bacterium]